MTRVIFYAGVADKLAFLCRFLHQRVFRPRQTALIYGDAALIAQVDERLWTSEYFLPHELLPAAEDGAGEEVAEGGVEHGAGSAGGASAIAAPIALTAGEPPQGHISDMLILLSAQVPMFAGSYPICIDIVGAGDADKQAGRERYRYFQEKGYSVEVLTMDGASKTNGSKGAGATGRRA